MKKRDKYDEFGTHLACGLSAQQSSPDFTCGHMHMMGQILIQWLSSLTRMMNVCFEALQSQVPPGQN